MGVWGGAVGVGGDRFMYQTVTQPQVEDHDTER